MQSGSLSETGVDRKKNMKKLNWNKNDKRDRIKFDFCNW